MKGALIQIWPVPSSSSHSTKRGVRFKGVMVPSGPAVPVALNRNRKVDYHTPM